jgi:exodeoxyribonuclease VII large subunit
LVVIRGGGSVTDLAWLNDLHLATVLCLSPIPVFTGIGHERDQTILDDIPHSRFDTPSKVALHITTTIKDNALGAVLAWRQINTLVGRIVMRERTLLETQMDRIETGARSVLRRVESEQEGFVRLIQTTMTAQVREASIALVNQRDKVIGGAEQARCDAELGLDRLLESITQKVHIQLESERSEIARLVHTVTLKAQNRLDAAGRDLDQITIQVGRDAGRMVTRAVDDLDKSLALVKSGVATVTDDARKDIEGFARIVVGLGPQSTLQRGFAIVRDDKDLPLTSREAAMNHATFQVQFHDGRVTVKNTDRSGGDER